MDMCTYDKADFEEQKDIKTPLNIGIPRSPLS